MPHIDALPEKPQEISASAGSWRQGRRLALAEFALVLLIFYLDISGWHHLIKLSKTLYLLPIGWISLRLRGVGWKGVGFTWPANWKKAIAVGVLGGIGIELMELFITQPLFARFFGKAPDLSLFRSVAGNYKLLALMLAGTWTLAAFGEELVYRGWLMPRFAGLFRNARAGWIASLVVINILFGFAHEYQGVTGVLENALDGALLGLIYLGSGRNLVAPIVAHGITDTVDSLLIFLGKYPGM